MDKTSTATVVPNGRSVADFRLRSSVQPGSLRCNRTMPGNSALQRREKGTFGYLPHDAPCMEKRWLPPPDLSVEARSVPHPHVYVLLRNANVYLFSISEQIKFSLV